MYAILQAAQKKGDGCTHMVTTATLCNGGKLKTSVFSFSDPLRGKAHQRPAGANNKAIVSHLLLLNPSFLPLPSHKLPTTKTGICPIYTSRPFSTPALQSTAVPQVTEDTTPPGPIFKAQVLHSKKSESSEKGVVGNIRSRRQLSDNVSFGVGIILGAE